MNIKALKQCNDIKHKTTTLKSWRFDNGKNNSNVSDHLFCNFKNKKKFSPSCFRVFFPLLFPLYSFLHNILSLFTHKYTANSSVPTILLATICFTCYVQSRAPAVTTGLEMINNSKKKSLSASSFVVLVWSPLTCAISKY